MNQHKAVEYATENQIMVSDEFKKVAKTIEVKCARTGKRLFVVKEADSFNEWVVIKTKIGSIRVKRLFSGRKGYCIKWAVDYLKETQND